MKTIESLAEAKVKLFEAVDSIFITNLLKGAANLCVWAAKIA